MNTDFTYNYIGTIDVSEYVELFSTNDDWDNKWNRRRHELFPLQRGTDIIPVMWSAKNLGEPAHIQAPKSDLYEKYYNSVFFEEVYNKISESIGNGYFIRLLFARLNSHSDIPVHQDTGESLINNHRIHIPIITNKDVVFESNGDTRHLPAGTIVEVNNVLTHGAFNNSDLDRIHLIIDWHRIS